MFTDKNTVRGLALGLVMAALGFCYATSTGGQKAAPPVAVEMRAVGSLPLQFTNPIVNPALPNPDRDLGAAALGRSVVRYVRAAGGVRPYTFKSSEAPTLNDVISGSKATLTLFSNGMLFGSLGKLTMLNSPLRFKVTVVDSKGAGAAANTVTEVFRLTLDNSGVFKFAIDQLSAGVQYQSYADILQVLNGTPPYTFSVSDVKANGAAVPSLESVGLSISADDGTVFGKPLVPGTITFTANCADSNFGTALARDGIAVGQFISLTVVPTGTVVSDVVATGVAIKTGVAGAGSIKYAGIINLQGTTVASLSGKKLVLRIGGYTTPDTLATPATLDDKGKTIKPQKIDASKSAPTLSSSVNSNGQIKIAVGKEDFGAKFGVISGKTKMLPVEVQLGDTILGSEVLQFEVKSSGSSSTLTYKFSAASNPGGTFLLTKVSGKDALATEGDSWKVSFVATPAAITDGTSLKPGSFEGADKAGVSIGTTFTDSLDVVVSKEKVKSTGKRSSMDPLVTKLAMDGLKGKGSLQTGPLPFTATGIHAAAKAPPPSATFPINVSLNKGGVNLFFGEDALVIFNSANGSWSEKVPKTK